MASEKALAADLYAFVVYLHKNCNSDLFEAVGALELSLTQIKLLHHLEDARHELTLRRRPSWCTSRFPPRAGWSTTSSGAGSWSATRTSMTAA